MSAQPDLEDALERVEELQQQLDQLRRRIAPAPSRDQLPEGPFHIVVCRVGEDTTAFLQHAVAEVVMIAQLSRLPEAPFWIPGLLNLRGTMVPVIDLLARISRRPRRPELSDLIVICLNQGQLIGFIVQEVRGTFSSASDQISEPPLDLPYASYLIGSVRLEGQSVLLLSTAGLVATSELPEASA